MEQAVLTTTVVSARVYTNGCVVTCRGVAEVEAGDCALLVDCLPYGVADDSVRVRVPATASLVSVTTTHVDLPQKEEASKALRDCERRIAHVRTRMDNRTNQKALWLDRLNRGDEQGDLAAAETYLERLPEHLDALDQELAELQVELERLQDERDQADEALRELQAQESRGVLRLRLEVAQAGTMPFEVELRSSKASWHPVYDVLVDGFDAALRLRLRAEVTQGTGLDWQGVKLALSTAAPLVGGPLPRLAPVRLRKHVDPPSPGRFAGMARMASSAMVTEDVPLLEEMTETAMGDTGVVFANSLVEASAPQATANELTNSMEYDVPGTWDVPSDGDEVLVEVQTTNVVASYSWYAVPVLDDSVYMVATLEEDLSSEAMGHVASVYLEGEYCGKVVLDEPVGGRKQEVSLGVDSRMRASRRLVSRKAANTLLRGRFSEETVYELEIRSNRAEDVHVVLLDHVPLAEDKEISVDLGDVTGANHDEETGELRWELQAKPHETVRRRFAYTVSHPKGLKVDRKQDRNSDMRWCPSCGAHVESHRRFCPECGATLN